MKTGKKKTTNIEHVKAFRLKKSYLFESGTGENINEVLNRLIAVDSNDIKHAYLAFYNRLKYFSKTVFDEALYQSSSLGRFKAMRTNYFIIPSDLSEVIFCATQSQREQVINQSKNNYNLKESDIIDTSRIIIKDLEAGDKSKNQLSKKMSKESMKKIETKLGQKVIKSNRFEQTMNILLERWQIIPGKEKWDTIGKKFCLFEELHKKKSFSMEPDIAENNLILKYISGYGPVLIEDIAWWCGIPVSHVENTIKNNRDQIADIPVNNYSDPYYIMRNELKYFLNSEKLYHDSLHLLGRNDPILVGYRNHDFIVPDNIQDEIFNMFNESEPVLLINGEITGKWAFEEKKNTIDIDITLYKKIKEKTEDRLCREIDKLSDFVGDESKETNVSITYR
jgi:hypothetical protein